MQHALSTEEVAEMDQAKMGASGASVALQLHPHAAQLNGAAAGVAFAAAAGSPLAASAEATQLSRKPLRPHSSDTGDQLGGERVDESEANASAADPGPASTAGADAAAADSVTLQPADETTSASATPSISLSSFRRLLQSDSMCAAVLQHVCRTAPELLQPSADAEGKRQDSAALASTPPSFPSRSLQQESEEEQQRRIGRLRDQALVPGVIALVLSFLPVRQRLQLGAVSRQWRRGVQQPTLWRRVGWECACFNYQYGVGPPSSHCEDCSLRRLPPWLRGSLGCLHCEPTRLLSRSGLLEVASLTGVHHLWLKQWFAAKNKDHGGGPPQAVSADEVRRALKPMRLLSLRLASRDQSVEKSLFDALLGPAYSPTSQTAVPLLEHWAPTLTDLHFDEWTLWTRPTGLLQCASGLIWPQLRSLQIDIRNDAAVLSVPFQLSDLLSRAPQLQTLRLYSFRDGPALTAALLAALPHLRGLVELHIDFLLELGDEQPADWLPAFHLLPALRVLRYRAFGLTHLSAPFIHSFALAPRLEVLHLPFNNFVPLFLKRLADRCTGAAESSGGDAPVALRQLHTEGHALGAKELRVLSLLPHLERLVCRIDPIAIAELGAFPCLRSLTVSCGSWTDAHYRQLGELRLPHLEELAISDIDQTVTVTHGLCHLLQLPALKHLHAYVEHEDTIQFLRLLADNAGRHGLLIGELCLDEDDGAFPLFQQ